MLNAICNFLVADLKEQHICIKFSFRIEKTASQMCEMLKTSFGDNIMGRTEFWVVFSLQIWGNLDWRLWALRLHRQNCGKLHWIINEDWWCSILDIVGKSDLLYGICQWIVREGLNMQQITADFAVVAHWRAEAPPVYGCDLHPPYLPDLAPCEFIFILRIKTAATRASFPECPWNSRTPSIL